MNGVTVQEEGMDQEHWTRGVVTFGVGRLLEIPPVHVFDSDRDHEVYTDHTYLAI